MNKIISGINLLKKIITDPITYKKEIISDYKQSVENIYIKHITNLRGHSLEIFLLEFINSLDKLKTIETKLNNINFEIDKESLNEFEIIVDLADSYRFAILNFDSQFGIPRKFTQHELLTLEHKILINISLLLVKLNRLVLNIDNLKVLNKIKQKAKKYL